MKKTLKILSAWILLAAICALPAFAGITFTTQGQAKVGGLILGGTTITSTGIEINKLTGVAAGVASASKAVVLGTNRNIDTLVIAASGLKIGTGTGTAVTSTAAELNTLAGVSAGLASASKAVVLGTNRNLDTLTIADGGLKLGSGAGTSVTVSANEINSLSEQIASYSATVTPDTGSNAAQFAFKNAAGTAISSMRTMMAYISTSAGEPTSAVTSIAALTNGQLVNLATGSVSMATTTAGGFLGVTTTAEATGSYYLTFVLPNGKLLTSPALVVN